MHHALCMHGAKGQVKPREGRSTLGVRTTQCKRLKK